MSSRLLESSAQLRRDLAAMWATPVDIVDVPRRRVGGAASPDRPLHTFAALPSTSQPRIVATDSRAALAATVRRFSHSTGFGARSARIALATAIRMGALELTSRDRLAVIAVNRTDADRENSVTARLGEIFGTEVSIGMSLGAVRANRKPVLHVLTPDGRSLGFAKLGLSPLARSLLNAEAENLRLLAQHSLQHLELPRVIHHGVWHEHTLLVMTALPAPLRRRHSTTALPVQAMAELAECEGTSTSPLTESPWFNGVVAATVETRDSSADRFHSLLERLGQRHGDQPVRFGSWHGDWGPWNMVWAGDRVRLWDWERFARGVPYGLDALYYAMFLPPARADVALLRESTVRALAPFSIGGPEADLLLPLYLTTLCARFLPDSLTEHGLQLRPKVVTLLDLLERVLGAGATRTVAAAAKPRPAQSGARPEEVRR
jgi:hypothetical protein